MCVPVCACMCLSVLVSACECLHVIVSACAGLCVPSCACLCHLVCACLRVTGYLKRLCETDLGLVTQVCLAKNISKGPQYNANVALKINAKVYSAPSVLACGGCLCGTESVFA